MAKAIFVDRDGTLIVEEPYLRDPSLVRLIPGCASAIRPLQNNGYDVVLVSNQSGVGRGFITREQHDAVHARMVELLKEESLVLNDVRYCFHRPKEGCTCRKPKPGMLIDSAREREYDLAASIVIGDRLSDLATGYAAGCRSFRLGDPVTPDWWSLLGLLEYDAGHGPR